MFKPNFISEILVSAAQKQKWRNDEEMSAALGVTSGVPSMIRRGKRLPSMKLMLKICRSAEYPERLGIAKLEALRHAGTEWGPFFEEWARDLEEKEQDEAA